MRTTTKLNGTLAAGILIAPLLGCSALEHRPAVEVDRPIPMTVIVITREPQRVCLVKPTGATIRALLGPVRDVTCCGLEACWWSESVYACLFELSGDVCETAVCNEAGCVCTS